MNIHYDKIDAVLQHQAPLQERPDEFVDSEAFGHFYKALYDAELIIEFDWMEWTGHAEEYVNRPELIEGADLDTVCKFLTTHVRNDRFCEGHLRGMIINGHIAAILRRLNDLVGAAVVP